MTTKRAVDDKVSKVNADQTSVFAFDGSPCGHGCLSDREDLPEFTAGDEHLCRLYGYWPNPYIDSDQ